LVFHPAGTVIDMLLSSLVTRTVLGAALWVGAVLGADDLPGADEQPERMSTEKSNALQKKIIIVFFPFII
jgi:hypothetical protein